MIQGFRRTANVEVAGGTVKKSWFNLVQQILVDNSYMFKDVNECEPLFTAGSYISEMHISRIWLVMCNLSELFQNTDTLFPLQSS